MNARRVVVVLVAALLSIAPLGPPDLSRAAASPGDPQPALSAAMRVLLDGYNQRVADPSLALPTRQLADAALLALEIRGEGARAQSYLSRAFEAQDTSLASPTYGELKVDTHDSGITDLNSVQFDSLPLGVALTGFRDDLSPQFLQSFRPHVVAALAAVQRQDVPVTYTNVYLMKTVNLLLLGRFLDDGGAIAEGRRQLAEWVATTRATGIHEFDSPTYYAVDLFSLSAGYRYDDDAADRRMFEASLRYIWTDIAANYFAPASKLDGPYSREYDFVAGNGILSFWLAAVGLAPPDELKQDDPEFVFVYDALRAGGYTIPASVFALARSGPREVTSSWDGVAAHTRFDWLGRAVALGCTSGTYDSEDRFLTGTFAGPPSFPQISIGMEQRSMPYGSVDSRVKPEHLAVAVQCAERDGAALLTENVPAFLTARDPSGIATDVVLPASASIAADGRRIELTQPGAVPISPRAVVTASAGGGTFALRIVHLDAADAIEPRVELVADAVSLARHVVWLRITHVPPGVRSNAQHVLVAVLVLAQDGGTADEAEAQVRSARVADTVRGDLWTISAALPRVRLELERSVSNRNGLIAARIDGSAPQRDRLAVDGRDLASGIWSRVLAP